MFTNFQPSSTRRYLVTTRQLKQLCREACSIEEMALFWCGRDRSILVSKVEEARENLITFSFFLKKRLIGSVTAKQSVLMSRYPEYVPLDETVLRFADQEGARPNDAWFEDRSTRLGVHFSFDHNMNYAPAGALSELVLSYVFSTSGFAEIKGFRRDDTARSDSIQVGLIFLGSRECNGWAEEFLVKKQELLELVNLRSRKLTQLIH